MKRILSLLLLSALPGYSQTAQPSNLTLNNLTVTGGMTAPTLTLGNGGPYTLKLPTAAPTQNSLLGILSISGGVAQSQWVKGYNGTLKIAATCSVTVVNGLITAKVGC